MRELQGRREVAVIGQPGQLHAAAARVGTLSGECEKAHAEGTFRNRVGANLIGAWRMTEAGRPVQVVEPAGVLHMGVWPTCGAARPGAGMTLVGAGFLG
jgi:hypothetical protein